MNEDKLNDLLNRLDRTLGPPPVSTDLARRVRQKARRQKRTAVLCASAAAVVLLLSLTIGILNRNDKPLTQPPTGMESPQVAVNETDKTQNELTALRQEIEQLKAEADARMKIVEEMIALEKKRNTINELERQLASMKDPLEEVRQQVEKAAFILVYQADRKLNEYNLRDSALADYHQAVELFPNTRAAQKAKQKISELETTQTLKGDLL